ncbi:MAG: hypothetical protein V4543_00880 [Bacteroidota bacterium]
MKITQGTINERFIAVCLELISQARIKNVTQLATHLGWSQSQLNGVLTRAKSRNATSEMLASLLQVYPDVNPMYLMGREVPMFLGGNLKSLGPLGGMDFIYIPYVSVSARSVYVKTIVTGESYEIDKIRLPIISDLPYEKCTVFEINGDAMEPHYLPRAKLLAMPVSIEELRFISSGVYVVVFSNRLAIKRVKDNDIVPGGFLKLHSDNTIAGSQNVPAEEIRALWKAVLLVESPAN